MLKTAFSKVVSDQILLPLYKLWFWEMLLQLVWGGVFDSDLPSDSSDSANLSEYLGKQYFLAKRTESQDLCLKELEQFICIQDFKGGIRS